MLRCLLLAIALGTCACATVPPWDRGILAKSSMNPEAGDAVTAGDFENHTFDVREGSSPCGGGAGGGCGCN